MGLNFCREVDVLETRKIDHPHLGKIEVIPEFGRFNIYQNGKLCSELKGKGQFTTKSGEIIDYKVVASFTKDLPDIKIAGGEKLSPGHNLTKGAAILIFLPLLILPAGGAIGGFLGGTAIVFNQKIIRSQKSRTAKIAYCLASTMLAAILWLIASGMINTAYLYYQHAGAITELETKLQKEPCNAEIAEKLFERLNKAGNFKKTIKITKSYTTKCEPFPLISWHRYEANTQLGRFKAALKDTMVLQAADPDDVDFVFWQAQTYQRLKHYKKTVESYKKALRMAPTSEVLVANYTEFLIENGKHCRAAKALKSFAQKKNLHQGHQVNKNANSILKKHQCG